MLVIWGWGGEGVGVFMGQELFHVYFGWKWLNICEMWYVIRIRELRTSGKQEKIHAEILQNCKEENGGLPRGWTWINFITFQRWWWYLHFTRWHDITVLKDVQSAGGLPGEDYDTLWAERNEMKVEKQGEAYFLHSFFLKSFCKEEGCFKKRPFYSIITTTLQIHFSVTNF